MAGPAGGPIPSRMTHSGLAGGRGMPDCPPGIALLANGSLSQVLLETVVSQPTAMQALGSQISAQDDLDEEVVMCRHDPLWLGKACELASDIETHLCDLSAKGEHVGSTAVPGLEAKPILDLLVGFADQQGIDEAALRLSAIGW
jgi:GrpB protein